MVFVYLLPHTLTKFAGSDSYAVTLVELGHKYNY